MGKAVIYARVSSKDQEKEGSSIPSQLKLLRGHAKNNNYHVVKEFTNEEAASKAGRKMFNEMLTFVEENNIKHIFVEKTDRLLRNITDYSKIDELIRSCDVKIHLIKENVELSRDSKSNEKFMFGIKALMAKNFTDNLLQIS